MVKNSLIEVCVDIIHETDMAFLVSDGDIETWLPKSQVEDFGYHCAPSYGVTIEIPEWLAKDKGLI